MAAKLTPAQRDDLTAKAYSLSLTGAHAPEIAHTLGISDTTVDALLKRERQQVAKRRALQREHDLQTFLEEMDQDRNESYKRGTAKTTSAAAAASHIGNATAASVNKAKALGLFVEKHDITSGGKSLAESLAELMATPIRVEVAGSNPFEGEADAST